MSNTSSGLSSGPNDQNLTGAPVSQTGTADGTTYNAMTGLGNINPNAAGSYVSDPTSWGGVAGRVVIGPDGKPTVDTTQSGRATDVANFQAIGQQDANRAAPTMNFAAGDAQRNQGLGVRGQQSNALAMLGNAARGNAPSAAAIQSSGGLDDAFQSQLQAGSGAKGGIGQQGAAARAGYMNGASQGLATAQNSGAARSGELNAARSAYAGGAGNVRTGDLTQQNADQQRAGMQYANAFGQAKLNQMAQEGNEQTAWNVNKYAQDAGQKEAQVQLGNTEYGQQRENAAADRMASFYGNAISQAGKAGGAAYGAASDGSDDGSGGDPNA